MDRKTYYKIRAGVAAGISMMMAYSVLNNSWAMATGTVALGMIILVVAKKQVDAILYDERTKVIREKAANATVGLVTVAFAVIALILIETSYWGYPDNGLYGYLLAYIALIIMCVNGFFNWYYNNRMGG